MDFDIFAGDGEHMLKRISLIGMLIAACCCVDALAAGSVLKLSTSTSTENSGLLKYLLPYFEAQSGIRVQVIAAGTGKALKLAQQGEVDVTLVHARVAEDKFMAEGDGVERREVMHNDFVLVGPASDPLALGGRCGGNGLVLDAFRKIAAGKAAFVSRGDGSGTDIMEQSYWLDLHFQPRWKGYVLSGKSMGETLLLASQLGAYTLSDRAAYAAYRGRTGLVIFCEHDKRMANPYSVIAVNPARHKDVNFDGAQKFITWLTSKEGQRRIAEFNIEGEQVFFPNIGGVKSR